MPLPRKSRTILVTVGLWTIWTNTFTFSENTSRRNGICDGSGWNSLRSGAEGLKLCRNRNALRSEGIRSPSWVDGISPRDGSSSELSVSSPTRPRVSISSPSSCSASQRALQSRRRRDLNRPTYLVVDPGPEAAAHIAAAARILKNQPAKLLLHTAGIRGR